MRSRPFIRGGIDGLPVLVNGSTCSIPSQLSLCCPCRYLSELTFERSDPLKIRHGEFFYHVGGTHADELVRMVHAVYQGRNQCRLSAYDRHHLIGAINGAPITATQHRQDTQVVQEATLRLRCH